jgi:hypothetical protein
VRRNTWLVVIRLATYLAAAFTFTFMLFQIISSTGKWLQRAYVDTSLKEEWSEERHRTDSLFDVIMATVDSLTQPQVQDTSEVVRVRDVSYLFDTLTQLSKKVDALSKAITPQNATGIVTLQRLGDRYEILTQTVENLKSDVEKSRLANERMLADHAARVDAELNRFTPMIWGMLVTVVLIVIQNVWTQRKKKEE